MAIPLKKFAILCDEVAVRNGRLSPASSPSVPLYDISRAWRSLCGATCAESKNIPGQTEKEEYASEVIIAALTYLNRIGCRDIESLLRNTLEHHRRQGL